LSKKTQDTPDYIHPKEIIRSVMLSLPDFSEKLQQSLRLTAMALYTYSHGYHEKDDLDGGYIKFSGTISYGQIAKFVKCSYKSAQRHCARLNEMKLLTWHVGKHWIEFTVCIAAAKVEFQDEDIKNQYDDSTQMTLWKPSNVEGDFGRPVAAGTIRYVGGKCPYCKWDKDKRTGWCIDCYEEARGEGDGEVAVQWAVGEDEEYCGNCGSSAGCYCEPIAEAAKQARTL
jgi:hypothetical protein